MSVSEKLLIANQINVPKLSGPQTGRGTLGFSITAASPIRYPEKGNTFKNGGNEPIFRLLPLCLIYAIHELTPNCLLFSGLKKAKSEAKFINPGHSPAKTGAVRDLPGGSGKHRNGKQRISESINFLLGGQNLRNFPLHYRLPEWWNW